MVSQYLTIAGYSPIYLYLKPGQRQKKGNLTFHSDVIRIVKFLIRIDSSIHNMVVSMDTRGNAG
jgi:hypothetical protein